ncbi:Leucine rich repeat 4 [Phaffia rhodozyma]|uniref:Leucine rich repeat 4 n=1 Tax=Phaffia rhodozyma TaxID=264483 RepID=A0A0F7SRN4_PHARH|nr:Leucine rich repeat 4 [Phaffia rhodozyma]
MLSIPADTYIHNLATFIQSNSTRLAASSSSSRRPPSSSSFFPSLSFSSTKPLVLRITPQNLFYVLLRFQAIGLDVGELDQLLEAGVRDAVVFGETSFKPSGRDGNRNGKGSGDANRKGGKGSSDWMETGSFMSAVSAVSTLSLGGWWSVGKVRDPDTDLKLIYSAFTKLPSLVVYSSGWEDDVIEEMAGSGPLDTAVPLKVFKNLQSLEIHSIPPSILLIPPSPILRSLTVKSLNSSSMDDEGLWILPLLFGPEQEGGTSHSRKRIDQDVVLEEEEDEAEGEGHAEGSSKVGAIEPTASSSAKSSPLKFPYLSHLGLSSTNLLTFPTLPADLPSIVSLDLSSNLLIEVPASLKGLTRLTSLNLGGNMIDSLRGIDKILPGSSQIPKSSVSYAGRPRPSLHSHHSYSGLRVISLDNNRLANLHGLSLILTLERISLRGNQLTESLELTRLVTLPVLKDLYVLPQPFLSNPAEDDWKVGVWEAFIKEGRGEDDIMLDGVGCGWVEKKKMRASVGTVVSTNNRRVSAPVVVGDGGETGYSLNPEVLNVSSTEGLRNQKSLNDLKPSNPKTVSSAPPTPRSSARPNHHTGTIRNSSSFPARRDALASMSRSNAHAHAHSIARTKRRRQRIVNLSGEPESGVGTGLERIIGDDSENSTGTDQIKSEDELRQGGKGGRGRSKTGDPSSTSAGSSSISALHASLSSPSSPYRSSQPTRQPGISTTIDASPRRHTHSPPQPTQLNTGSLAELESGEAFRKKLEAMRSEVGDSWLRVLTAGVGPKGSASSSDGGSGSGGGGRSPSGEKYTRVDELPTAPAVIPAAAAATSSAEIAPSSLEEILESPARREQKEETRTPTDLIPVEEEEEETKEEDNKKADEDEVVVKRVVKKKKKKKGKVT